jgi:general secretion pathway protein J
MTIPSIGFPLQPALECFNRGRGRLSAALPENANGSPLSRGRLSAALPRSIGFTLIEILAALVIFAIMAALSYRALASVLDSREQLNAETQKWRDCALFFARVEQDLQGMLKRPVRSAEDIVVPAFAVNPDAPAEAILALTRSGFAQADGLLAAPQRVGYRLRERRVELLLWPHPDMAPRTAPQVFPVLSNVADFSVRALDARGNWQTRWPAAANSAASVAPEYSPALVELNVTLSSGETLTRLFAMRAAL